ncbi:MAG: DUF1653 domain-containing protein [Lachnospiraceae bacterium]|nr:DUF1653 domain-containing protein [Lachnospiraceae bacterium]
MRNEPKPQEIYQHLNGKRYQVISLAEHSETGEELVIYQALYDEYKVYARPLSMFMGELKAAEADDPELKEVDPLVLEFLGADSHEKRLQILSILQLRISDSMINIMAASLDLEISDGEVEERYDELKHCLMTMRKFEINR